MPGRALHELEDLCKPAAGSAVPLECRAQWLLRLQLQWIRIVVYQEIPSDEDHYTSLRRALHVQGHLNLWQESEKTGFPEQLETRQAPSFAEG